LVISLVSVVESCRILGLYNADEFLGLHRANTRFSRLVVVVDGLNRAAEEEEEEEEDDEEE
jgi:hypothetical protein